MTNTVNIAILSPIEVEHKAILSHMPNVEEKILSGHRYLCGQLSGKNHLFNIITRQAGSKNETIALATEKVIHHFQPVAIILAGVAGGVKDVSIGDVVVGTKYYGYESGKVTADGFASRPESGPYSQELITVAKSVSCTDSWWHRAENAAKAKVVFGPIAGGNKVIATTDSDTYRLLKQTYNDTTAIEMEAAGFGQAMLSYPATRFLNIRGISDLLDAKSKSDAGGSQELAADNMAAFVFEFLYHLNVSKFKIIGSMDIKELAKEIIGLIMPIVKLDAVQEIGDDLEDATNGSVRELWAKAKPLFIEEYEALKKTPDDADAQADARSSLRQALKNRGELKNELEGLVEKVKKEKQGSKVLIKNSKNVVQGSTISVGGDFRLGDG